MARPLRLELSDALYHVTCRGNEQRAIFRSDRDRKAFLGFLAETVRRFGWSVTAWVLMTNHFHLVFQTPQPNLSQGMHWFNSAYVGWFNRVHKRSGHLYQGRFKAFLIEKEAYFAEVLRYVVLNPVRAHMVERPEDYKWSSYRATAGLDAAPDWLDLASVLPFFHPERDNAQRDYREFVCAKIDGDDCLWDKLTNRIFLGTETWIKDMRKIVETKPRSTDHPREQRAVGRPQMHTIVDAVAKATGTSAASIRETRGNVLRRLAAWIAWHEGLITLRSIAAGLRLRSEGHISNLIRRCDREFGLSETLLGYLDAALVTIRA
ncbi:MAG TPA: transposase [Thermoanaerobaculia bacterium]|jgi:putative transposase|nr:transposase [Thermoanaerobaculia bacterium]